MNFLETHASILARMALNGSWEITQSGCAKKYVISSPMAAILALFSGKADIDDVFRSLNTIIKINYEEFIFAVEQLKNINLLVASDNDSHNFAKEVFHKWHHYNWIESANYYLATYDYPFVFNDQVDSYLTKEKKRMLKYFEAEPDTNRSKEYPDSLLDYKLSDINIALNELNIDFANGLTNNVKRSVTMHDIETICVVAFGKLRGKPSLIPNKADSVRKTSPSGGSRHPTEGYVILLEKVGDLESGVYHYSLAKNALELIELVIPDNITDIFPGVFRAKFTPKVIFVLTSLFERNMYRYREPRTFRTVFMDAGHMAETVKLLSTSLNLNYFAHTYINEEDAEHLLKLKTLQEGVIYNMALS